MIRKAMSDDVAAITLVRTAVEENHLSMAQMAERGITRERIMSELKSGALGGWVAEDNRRIIAFSMAYRDDAQIFALITLAAFERKGWGSRLLSDAVAWLNAKGHTDAWLAR